MTAKKMNAVRLEELKTLLFDSGWFRQSEGHELLDEIDRAWEEIEKLGARVSHAHNAANALYEASSTLCEAVCNLDYWEIDDPEGPSIEDALKKVHAVFDPKLQAAALAETQRRDGLDKRITEATKDRDDARASERTALAERERLANILCAVLPVALRVVESGGDAADVIELGGLLVGLDARLKAAPLTEAEARAWAAGIVRSVPIDGCDVASN